MQYYLIAAALASVLLQGCATTPPPPGRWASSWDTYISRAVPYGFGGGFLVAADGGAVLRAAYGLADRDAGVRATPRTVFYIGSLTKQFTAAAIMKLAEEGRLSPHDPITKFFRDVPEDKRLITLHHLMTHTAGLAHDVGDTYRDQPGRDEQVARILQSKLASTPGTEYAYSNPGFSLLAAVVEIVSRSDYEQFVSDRLFKPAGMTETGYVLPRWDRGRVAHAYEDGRDVGSLLDRAHLRPEGASWSIRGAGGMLSTLDDLHRWDVALRGETVLSNASKEQLFAKHVDREDGTFYGYAWVVEESAAGREVRHNGSDGVNYAAMRRTPRGALIGWTNQSVELYLDIERSLSLAMDSGAEPRHLPPIPQGRLSDADRARYAGTYRLSSGGSLEITATADGLVMEPVGHDALSLIAGRHDDRRVAAARAFLDAVVTAMRSAPGETPGLAERMAGAISASTRSLGALSGYDVIGTIGSGTHARLRFASGTFGLELEWDGDKVGGASLGTGNPARTMLRRLSDTELVGFSFPFEQPVRLRFADGVVIETPHGKASAQRLSRSQSSYGPAPAAAAPVSELRSQRATPGAPPRSRARR